MRYPQGLSSTCYSLRSTLLCLHSRQYLSSSPTSQEVSNNTSPPPRRSHPLPPASTVTEVWRGYCPVIGRRIDVTSSAAYSSNAVIQITYQSVPTPVGVSVASIDVDFNEMVIQVSSTTRGNLYLRSYYMLNSCRKVTFLQQTSQLVINGNQRISITKGTYSSPLTVAVSLTAVPFASNVQIISTSAYLAFLPASTVLLYGKTSATTRIGAGQDLSNKLYPFTVAKTEIA